MESGLSVGDVIIAEGAGLVREGATIKTEADIAAEEAAKKAAEQEAAKAAEQQQSVSKNA